MLVVGQVNLRLRGDGVSILFLLLLPIISVTGTTVMNAYGTNTLLEIALVAVCFVPILTVFSHSLRAELYPFAVFAAAISLMYHTSLISRYLIGWDINYEFYFSNMVSTSGRWDLNTPRSLNSMLSVVMLAPMTNAVSGTSLTTVFKVVYPMLYSLVPVCLFTILKKQVTPEIAFLSCFFFMALFVFYQEMIQLARQQIAELFLALLILTVVRKGWKRVQRSFLFVIFSFSLVTAHYATSYLCLALLAGGMAILLTRRKWRNTSSKTNNSKYRISEMDEESIRKVTEIHVVTPILVLLFASFAVAWYTFVASASSLSDLLRVGGNIISSIYTDFFSPRASQGLNLLVANLHSPLHEASRYLHVTMQFFIVVGMLRVAQKKMKAKFNEEYLALAEISIAVCLAAIALPYFASSLNTSRLYHLTLIILAPFCIIGGLSIFETVAGRIPRATRNGASLALRIMAITLVTFLLFNSGWIYEIANDNPTSFALNGSNDFPRFNEREVTCAIWLGQEEHGQVAYGDLYRYLLLVSFVGYNATYISSGMTGAPDNSFVFIGTYNLEHIRMLEASSTNGKEADYVLFEHQFQASDRIYDNGGGQILAGG